MAVQQKLRLKISGEMQVCLNKINLLKKEDKTDLLSAKWNYFHGRYEGLQWVLDNMNN